MQDKKILVTGGAGFIGSHIVEALVGSGWQVTVYDNMSSGHASYLSRVKDKINFVEADILDSDKLVKACSGQTVISHQAAQLEIFKCLDDPAYDLKINTLGTLNILNAAREARVQRVISASSACVYGQARRTPQPEDDVLEPNWPYGISKLASEQYGQIFSLETGVPVIHLRYGIVLGPREWLGRVLTCFLRRALSQKPLVIFGNGNQVRDFIDVSDVVRFHQIVLEQPKLKHSVFKCISLCLLQTNLKHFKQIIKDLLHLIFEQLCL